MLVIAVTSCQLPAPLQDAEDRNGSQHQQSYALAGRLSGGRPEAWQARTSPPSAALSAPVPESFPMKTREVSGRRTGAMDGRDHSVRRTPPNPPKVRLSRGAGTEVFTGGLPNSGAMQRIRPPMEEPQ
jgi:hypothetical protein